MPTRGPLEGEFAEPNLSAVLPEEPDGADLDQRQPGRPGRRKRVAEELRGIGWDPPANACDAGHYLSHCIPIVLKDDRATDEERVERVRFYGDEAMKMLRVAVARGYRTLPR